MNAVLLRRGHLLQTLLLPVLVGSVALAVAVIGAILVGNDSGIDGVNSLVEGLSGNSSSFFGGLGILAPWDLPSRPVLRPLSTLADLPCCPPTWPYTWARTTGTMAKGIFFDSLAGALLVGGSVTAGFIVLFGVAGMLIGVGARSAVADILPWLGLGIGVALTIAGAWMLGGGKLYTGIAQRAAGHMGDPSRTSVRGYFLFGLSYGTASLSCTLPIFLAVVGTSFAVSSIGTSLGQFVLYAMGMGLVIIALTLGMALFKGGMVGALRKALPHIQPVGTWMMILAGSYIVFYWLTIGELL